MRRHNPILFFAVYFLVIFLWLAFCYKQVQKACQSAGHTESDSSAMEIVSWPEEQEIADRAENGQPFFYGGNDSAKKETELPENKTQENPAAEDSAPESSAQENSAAQNSASLTGENMDTLQAEPYEETIRVILTGAGGIYQEKVVLQSGEEILEITPESSYFQDTNIIRVRLSEGEEGKITVNSLEKSCGKPSYDGFLEIRREDKKLILINEVSLEDYVKGVLPSEMPSSYPPEALKAQAVCARTYAKMKQEGKAYPQYNAAVDDSTACQVYQNLEGTGQGNLAVEETAGEVLRKEDGTYSECYYYSTSCGRGATGAVWHSGEKERPAVSGSEEEIEEMNRSFSEFILERAETDLEAGEAFYRWSYQAEKVKDDKVFEKCRQRAEINEKLVWAEIPDKGDTEPEIKREVLGNIRKLEIVERQEGGAADCLRISCKNGTVYVWGEYNIRCVLAQGGDVLRQDESVFPVGELLPSAFISLQNVCNKKGYMIGYIIAGGGFGHGVGMSQNGAKQMALAGKSYQEILAAYYTESHLSEN